MAARPTVSVYTDAGEASGSVALPKVFTAPIRMDVVQQVHSEFWFWIFGSGERGDGRKKERRRKGEERRLEWNEERLKDGRTEGRRYNTLGGPLLTPSPQSPWPRTDDRPTPSPKTPVTKPRPNPGVPVEPSPVSPVSVVVVPVDQARPPSVTCAEVVECSPPPRLGGSGT
jgi:hypothetical protein